MSDQIPNSTGYYLDLEVKRSCLVLPILSWQKFVQFGSHFACQRYLPPSRIVDTYLFV